MVLHRFKPASGQQLLQQPVAVAQHELPGRPFHITFAVFACMCGTTLPRGRAWACNPTTAGASAGRVQRQLCRCRRTAGARVASPGGQCRRHCASSTRPSLLSPSAVLLARLPRHPTVILLLGTPPGLCTRKGRPVTSRDAHNTRSPAGASCQARRRRGDVPHRRRDQHQHCRVLPPIARGSACWRA